VFGNSNTIRYIVNPERSEVPQNPSTKRQSVRGQR
jgi:hypothetical protein